MQPSPLGHLAGPKASAEEAGQRHPLTVAMRAMRTLRHYGFGQVEHFGAQEPGERYLSERADGPRLSGIFRMIRATV